MRPSAQVAAVLLALAAAAGGVVRAEEVALALGGPTSVVAQLVRLELPAGVSERTLADVPATADPSSLQIRFREPGIAVEEWRRDLGSSGAVATDARGAVWRPDAAPAPARPALTARLRAERAVSAEAELTYLTTGLTWSARYAVLVRGNVSNEEEKIAMDLSARVRIENSTGRPFTGARILLVGEDRPGVEAPRSAAGFLILDDNPLDDPWRELPQERRPRFTYRLPQPVNVPARGA